MNIRGLLSILLMVFCFSCEKPLPVLDGIDAQRWKQDKNACGHVRHGMREAIDREKEKLLGLDEIQMVKLLGNPDQNELYSRNQKFFYYFIDPAPACGVATDSIAERLVIRFNAVGLAKEVSID